MHVAGMLKFNSRYWAKNELSIIIIFTEFVKLWYTFTVHSLAPRPPMHLATRNGLEKCLHIIYDMLCHGHVLALHPHNFNTNNCL